jgi:hypothetical protein
MIKTLAALSAVALMGTASIASADTVNVPMDQWFTVANPSGISNTTTTFKSGDACASMYGDGLSQVATSGDSVVALLSHDDITATGTRCPVGTLIVTTPNKLEEFKAGYAARASDNQRKSAALAELVGKN